MFFIVPFIFLCAGVIVRFVPFFNATKENEFYDDDPYWEVRV